MNDDCTISEMNIFNHYSQIYNAVSVSSERVSDKRDFACLPLTDLSKDFDCIEHELLIANLHT